MNMKRILLTAALALLTVPQLVAADPEASGGWPQMLERDWLLQAQLEGEGHRATKISTRNSTTTPLVLRAIIPTSANWNGSGV